MTSEEQISICKALTRACMWGHGGIQSVIIDELEKLFPMQQSWREVSSTNCESAKKEHLGVITDEEKLQRYLRQGYWLCNGDSLFNPPPMNGLCMYVSKDLYEKYTAGRGW